jgi:hypothetical protein
MLLLVMYSIIEERVFISDRRGEVTPEYSASIALSADDVIIANKTYGTVKTQPTVSHELKVLIDFLCVVIQNLSTII